MEPFVVNKKLIKLDLITLQFYIKDLKIELTSATPLWLIIEKGFTGKKKDKNHIKGWGRKTGFDTTPM